MVIRSYSGYETRVRSGCTGVAALSRPTGVYNTHKTLKSFESSKPAPHRSGAIRSLLGSPPLLLLLQVRGLIFLELSYLVCVQWLCSGFWCRQFRCQFGRRSGVLGSLANVGSIVLRLWCEKLETYTLQRIGVQCDGVHLICVCRRCCYCCCCCGSL